MRRSLTGSAVLLAAWAFTAPGTAAAALAAPAPAPAAPAAPADDDTIVLDEAESETPAKPAGEAKAGGEAGASTDLFGDANKGKAAASGETGKVSATSEADQLKQDKAFITVVQRQRFLKKKRFELQPQIGITVNDPFVRHFTVGAELNYWITNRMAVGITGTAFFGNKTSRYTNIRFQESVLLTANKTLWQASVNFLYNPFYGKIAVFNRALMHWESYVQVGGGAIQTQVIPRYEAIHEPFRHLTGQGNFAIGARFYGPRVDWISVNFGVRTWIYQDKLEPTERGPGPNQLDSLDSADAAKDAAVKKLAFNVVFFLGLSFYFPTSFQYTTRR
ncbi:outer membrane beta-barrel domain-containing protein [Nannocystis bainbridge]|uniref:Outer membrane beta-barrel domain-containing protein n=1 Tax=Nannocystis bainbridge TaxID=2995303 RepID=A0ABT5EDT0_9BACT|nr:outer membrane beta-barrel domain-containing protein [Nannocystis bainbridge]MDC0722941.1 outer membrane beta-barrel domain-containing protein [Nannocystis bainbridge]